MRDNTLNISYTERLRYSLIVQKKIEETIRTYPPDQSLAKRSVVKPANQPRNGSPRSR